MKSPKAPKPTAEDVKMRQRQTEDLANLDNEQNVRLKRLVRARAGGRSLLSGSALGMAGKVAASGGGILPTSFGGGVGKTPGGTKAPSPQATK